LQIVAEFVTSAAGAGDFPRDRLPEIAMVGRSNVGKSSLINALVRQPLARTSAAPGKTRLANFYRVQRGSSPPLYLVDLPGYGYARGGDASAQEFNRLVDAYFSRALGTRDSGFGIRDSNPSPESRAPNPGSGVPIGVLLLVDSRHPGLESDLETWSWLESQPCPRGVVGTKVDKLTRAERARHTREMESLFQMPVPLVSAMDGEGLDALWKLIVKLPSQTAAS
jgi:GTP-binding protein